VKRHGQQEMQSLEFLSDPGQFFGVALAEHETMRRLRHAPVAHPRSGTLGALASHDDGSIADVRHSGQLRRARGSQKPDKGREQKTHSPHTVLLTWAPAVLIRITARGLQDRPVLPQRCPELIRVLVNSNQNPGPDSGAWPG